MNDHREPDDFEVWMAAHPEYGHIDLDALYTAWHAGYGKGLEDAY